MMLNTTALTPVDWARGICRHTSAINRCVAIDWPAGAHDARCTLEDVITDMKNNNVTLTKELRNLAYLGDLAAFERRYPEN